MTDLAFTRKSLSGEGEILEAIARQGSSACAVEVVQGEWPKLIDHVWQDKHLIVTMLFDEPDLQMAP